MFNELIYFNDTKLKALYIYGERVYTSEWWWGSSIRGPGFGTNPSPEIANV